MSGEKKCDRCAKVIEDFNECDNTVDLPSVKYILCTNCVLDVTIFIDTSIKDVILKVWDEFAIKNAYNPDAHFRVWIEENL